MHTLEQGASLIIDERNVLKIHQNFAAGVIGASGAPAILQFGDVAFRQAAADLQSYTIANRAHLRFHHLALLLCKWLTEFCLQ
jgi:hypothetical protein